MSLQPNVTYSQFGEDVTSRHALRGVAKGFYVDIGAHHPTKHSNTALLHLRGWDGINVEPSKAGYRAFQRMRPHAINLHAAVHNDLDKVTLTKFEGGLVNTVLDHRAADLKGNHEVVGEEIVPAYSMNTLFERFVPEGVHVNYLSLDIEGYDREAILAFDLERFAPDVICVELYSVDFLHIGEDEVVRRLVQAGYQPYSINIYSFTFVNLAAADRIGNKRVKGLADATRKARARREQR